MKEKDLIEFWNKIQTEGNIDDCWLWTDRVDSRGYGIFKIDGMVRKVQDIVWEFYKGRKISGTSVKNKCCHPECCNPYHLFLYDNNHIGIRTPGISYSMFKKINGLISEGIKTSEVSNKTGVGIHIINSIKKGHYAYHNMERIFNLSIKMKRSDIEKFTLADYVTRTTTPSTTPSMTPSEK